MKRNLLLMMMVSSICLWLIRPALSQEEMQMIEAYGFEKSQRPPAVFKHDDHNETAEIEACNECHHIYEDGQKLEDESSEDQLCSDCHAEKSSGRQPGLKKAFHLNCKGCHQAKKKGPIMCGQCHVR